MILTSMNGLLRRRSILAIATALTLLPTASVSATTLEIQFTGLNVEYDGTNIFSTTSPDMLSAATLFLDGVPLTTLTTDLALDLFIPNVTGLSGASDAVTTVSSDGGGDFDLDLGATDFLDLSLAPVSVTYVDVSGVLQFALGASSASIVGQMLPDSLVLSDPVSVSFSTKVNPASITVDGNDILTGFRASGTGEVEADAEFDPLDVPEPQALVLGLFAILCIACSPRSLKNEP